MRVVVKFHADARADIEAWHARLSRPPAGDPALVRIFTEELVRLLEGSAGIPTGATFRPDLHPPRWVLRFSSDTWVEFIHKEDRPTLWGGITREVVVTGVAPQPPA